MRGILALFFLVLLPLTAARAQQQIDTTGGRYYQPLFPQITVTRGVAYGQARNVQGQNQTLRFDLYEPTGDPLAQRPLIIFAHEGGFVGGTRNDAFSTAFATHFARRGYVVASIDYRLQFFPLDTVNLAAAAFRAMQDMRGAIRFFRADAGGANQYRLAPDFIFTAGSSAGGVMALQVAYLDKDGEIPAYLAAQVAQSGGLQGTSGPAGVSSRVRATVGLCGSLGRPYWLEAGDVPVCFVHGTADGVVPYGRGTAGGGLPPLRSYGSGILAPRATALGVPNVLRTLRGAPHVPYNGTTARALAYADTTFRTVRDFLRPLLTTAGPNGITAAETAFAPAESWPVPATTAVRLRWSAEAGAFTPREAEVIDVTGAVVRRFRWTAAEQDLPRGALPAGTYLVRAPGVRGLRVVFE